MRTEANFVRNDGVDVLANRGSNFSVTCHPSGDIVAMQSSGSQFRRTLLRTSDDVAQISWLDDDEFARVLAAVDEGSPLARRNRAFYEAVTNEDWTEAERLALEPLPDNATEAQRTRWGAYRRLVKAAAHQ